MKLVVKPYVADELDGTEAYALVVEGWPANVSKERAQQYADYINRTIAYMLDIDDSGRPRGYSSCYEYERRTP